jgi:predicted murein hydrolase (TIGR00659 family)
MNEATAPLLRLWVYLGASPLLWLAVTVCAFVAAARLQRGLRGSPWANPVLLSVLLLLALLLGTGTPYERYFEGAQFVHFLLGMATVSLAVPLRRHWDAVKAALPAMSAALVIGNLVGSASAMAILAWFHAPVPVVLSIAPKSVTAPVAMGISEKIGGLPALTAVLVVSTGIFGAIVATPLLNALRLRDPAGRGFSVGIAAHGIGTARAFQLNETAGTFAGIGMAASTLVASVLVPVLARLFGAAA